MKTALAADDPRPRQQYTITATTTGNANTAIATLRVDGPGIAPLRYDIDSVQVEGPITVFNMGELLTEHEQVALRLTGELTNLLADIIGHSHAPEAAGDRLELTTHIHAIQNAVLAQAAARAYPGRYRLLGQLGLGLTAKDVD